MSVDDLVGIELWDLAFDVSRTIFKNFSLKKDYTKTIGNYLLFFLDKKCSEEDFHKVVRGLSNEIRMICGEEVSSDFSKWTEKMLSLLKRGDERHYNAFRDYAKVLMGE